MPDLLRRLVVILAALVPQSLCVGHVAAAHPLDPLSADEIAATVTVLNQAGDTDAETRYALIDLDEPNKAGVLAWQSGQSFDRKAFVIARRRRTVYQGVVDLGSRKVEQWRAVPNVESSILPDEWEAAQRITQADPGWQAAMRKRGYDPAKIEVFCAPLTAGYSTDASEAGRRLLKVTCFDTAGTTNVWARPIEGLVAVVENPNVTDSLGQHPGYELHSGHSEASLLAAAELPERRAGFAAAPLWITAYDPAELYAAGLYPNQNKGGDGLPAYVAKHRPIANADIVLWYTMGFHHVPRPEDWPVMPTMWHSLSLTPDGFFDRNPALDLRSLNAPVSGPK